MSDDYHTDMAPEPTAEDTSAEAVERLARSLTFVANRTGMTVERCEKITDDAAATLRALAAERDALKAELAGGSFYQEKDIDAMMARAEAAESEAERLREALEAAQESIATFIGVHQYPMDSGAGDVLRQVDAALAAMRQPE